MGIKISLAGKKTSNDLDRCLGIIVFVFCLVLQSERKVGVGQVEQFGLLGVIGRRH